MTRIALLISIILVATVTIFSQQRQDPPWLKEFVNKRIVYQVPGMKSVRVQRNLIYKRVAGRELEMDVYAPKTSRGPLPAVLFIHGGRVPPNLLTTPKDWAVYVSFGELMAASGFVGVTFNHRFHTWESLADSQADVMDAVKYVRENSAKLGVDSERIILWGISAGGIFLSHPLRDHPPFITCIVAYYAQLDLRDARKSAPATVTDQTLRDFSPVYYLEQDGKSTPPVLLARAGLDSADLNAGMDRFAQLSLSKNLTLDVLNHPTGHHGFDIEDDNDRSREILKHTIEFIRNHSRPKS